MRCAKKFELLTPVPVSGRTAKPSSFPPFFFGPQVHFHYHGIPQQVPSKQPRPEGEQAREHAVSIPLPWPRVLLATRVCMPRVRKQLVAIREWNWSEDALYYSLFQTLIGRIEGHFSLKVMSGHLTGVLPLLSVVGCASVCHSLPVCCFHCHLLSAWSHRGLLSGHWHIPSCPVWHNNYIKGFYQKHTPCTHTHTHTHTHNTHTHLHAYIKCTFYAFSQYVHAYSSLYILVHTLINMHTTSNPMFACCSGFSCIQPLYSCYWAVSFFFVYVCR